MPHVRKLAACHTSCVSVPRRALRGHAPPGVLMARANASRFSAPKGVERACPGSNGIKYYPGSGSFSAPKGVERACPLTRGVDQSTLVEVFQCPEGR